ncbi:MAG: FecR family protein [Verrucomicrobiota bacterium]
MTNSIRNTVWLGLPAILATGLTANAANIENFNTLKITEVVEKVDVINPVSKKQKPAQKDDNFKSSEVIETGAKSRAELVAKDGTVTRIGSNTVFGFSTNKRELNLEKGSVLFHSPTGKGGGEIHTSGATAAVLGTSVIVTATRDGGFKLLVLEGKAKTTLPNGKSRIVEAGQLAFVMPRSRDFGAVMSFRLGDQVSGAKLVQGFKSKLPSIGKITTEIQKQEKAAPAAKSTSVLKKGLDSNILQTGASELKDKVHHSESSSSPSSPSLGQSSGQSGGSGISLGGGI